jgi:hypothetical protein
MSFEIQCPTCNTALLVDPGSGMRTVRCGRCRALVSVPRRRPEQAEAVDSHASLPVPTGASPERPTADALANPFQSPEIGGRQASSPSKVVSRDGVVLVNVAPQTVEVGNVLSAAWHIGWTQLDSLLAAAVPSCIGHWCLVAGSHAVNHALGLWAAESSPLSTIFPADPDPVSRAVSWGLALVFHLAFVWMLLGEIAYFQAFARLRPVSWTRIVIGRRPFGRGCVLFLLYLAFAEFLYFPLLLMKPSALVVLAAFGMLIVHILVMFPLSQSVQLLVDKNLSVVDSMRVSVRLMRGNKATLFVVLVAFFVLTGLAMSALLVPMLIPFIVRLVAMGAFLSSIVLIWPVIATLLAVFYLQASGQSY